MDRYETSEPEKTDGLRDMSLIFGKGENMFKKCSGIPCLFKILILLAGFIMFNACIDDTLPEIEIHDKPVSVPKVKPSSGRGIGDTLRLLGWQAPTILNPHLTTSEKDWEVSRLTYEPLASYDRNGKMIPFLAAKIPGLENGGLSKDGKSVTWHLKKGVKWSDGELFTSDDVRFTYEFITNKDVSAASAPIYSVIESVKIIDDYTIKINFKDVNPAWSLPFVGIQGVILPRHMFGNYKGINSREAPANNLPVGTGPYRAKPPGIKPQEVLFLGSELIETNKIVFDPNPFFREKDKPFFSRVVVKGGGTVSEAARLVLQTGDVDYAWNLQINSETQAKLEKEGKGKAIANLGPAVERILLNRTDPLSETSDGERSSLKIPHPFLSDKNVRQALTYAIDREKISKLYPGSKPSSNMLVSPAKYQSPDTSYEFNLEKAAALLEKAGWIDSDGDGIRDKKKVKLKIVFQTSVNQVRQQTQNIIKQALESIGVEVELKITDSSILFSSNPSNPNTRAHFASDLLEFYTGSDSPDPGVLMKRWTCDQIPQKANNWSGTNVERWCNTVYDNLYKQSSTEIDPKKRQHLFIKMNDLLINDVVTIPLVHRASISGVSKTIEGVNLTPWDTQLWNIQDWRRKIP